MAINPKDLSKESLEINSNLKLFQIYKNLKRESLKCDTYFQVYEEMFNKYVGKKITFVEVGVLQGGFLFMWREYSGNHEYLAWMTLGSQSNKNFWRNFYAKVGKIDVLLDDGGHVNDQQIITLSESVNSINDGGIIMTEDVHTSYFKKFGNPSKYSYINYSKYLIDVVNSRFPETEIKKNNFRNKIYSISFYESIVAIKINSKKSIEPNILSSSKTKTLEVADLRSSDYFPKIDNYLNKNLPVVKKLPILKKIIRYLFYTHNIIIKIKYYFKLKKYFK